MNFLTHIIFVINTFWLGISPTVNDYTEGVVGQPNSFLPSQTVNKIDNTISRMIYRGLFEYDIYGTLIPDLAETWSISEDGLVYTIKLKDKQYWSNGKQINADDLIYTSYKVSNLAGVATDRVDDLTVRYTLPNKYSPFLNLLTVGVMPDESEEKMDQLNPISSGPFKVARVERSGPVIKQIVLVHEKPELDIRRLSFRCYANENEILTAAKLGEIDGFVSDQEYSIDNFEKFNLPLQGVYYALFFNLRDEKYQDVKLRDNLLAALDIDQLIYEKGIRVQGPISRSSFTDKSIDFDGSADISADYKDLTLRITVPDIKAHKKMAENIAHIWEDKFGLEVKTIEIASDKIVDEAINPRNFEILFYGQEVDRDPDRYINWHSTQKDAPGLNLSGFEQVRADRALEEGRNEPDQAKRVTHYNEFQKVVVETTPAIFLYHPFSKHYISKYIEGVGDKYTFTTGDRFLDFINWKHVKTN